MALCIWLLTDSSAYLRVTQDEQNFQSGIYVFLAIGILILLVGVLGCCGACNESQCLLVSVSIFNGFKFLLFNFLLFINVGHNGFIKMLFKYLL